MNNELKLNFFTDILSYIIRHVQLSRKSDFLLILHRVIARRSKITAFSNDCWCGRETIYSRIVDWKVKNSSPCTTPESRVHANCNKRLREPRDQSLAVVQKPQIPQYKFGNLYREPELEKDGPLPHSQRRALHTRYMSIRNDVIYVSAVLSCGMKILERFVFFASPYILPSPVKFQH